jgi:hypothetical protein
MTAAVLSVADARAVLEACTAVSEGAESSLTEAREELERRTHLRDLAVTARRAAEHRFDCEEGEAEALAVASARRDLDGAELLVAKARERAERGEQSARTAREAKERAARELRVAELRASLETPPAPLEAVERARDEVARTRDVAAAMLEEANECFVEELRPLFVRLDEDDRVCAELGRLGVQTAPVSPLHRVVPWLESRLRAGRLWLDTATRWTVRGGGLMPGSPPRVEPVEVGGSGELSAAYESLRPLRAALKQRDARAVLEALGALSRPRPACEGVALELLDLTAQHRDEAALFAAIAEREAVQREELRRDAEERALERREEQQREQGRSHRRFLENQAKLGNAGARRALGIDDMPFLEGPHPAVKGAAHAMAAALGLIDPSQATSER